VSWHSSSPGVDRMKRRALVVRLLVVAGLLSMLALTSLLWSEPPRGGLRVATAAGPVEPSGVLQGRLAASRAGDDACYSVTVRGTTAVLRFVDGWSAQERLAIVDPAGSVVARPGDTVTLLGRPSTIGTVAGCAGRGRIWTVTSARLSNTR
jgi:hypothetical protein